MHKDGTPLCSPATKKGEQEYKWNKKPPKKRNQKKFHQKFFGVHYYPAVINQEEWIGYAKSPQKYPRQIFKYCEHASAILCHSLQSI